MGTVYGTVFSVMLLVASSCRDCTRHFAVHSTLRLVRHIHVHREINHNSRLKTQIAHNIHLVCATMQDPLRRISYSLMS